MQIIKKIIVLPLVLIIVGCMSNRKTIRDRLMINRNEIVNRIDKKSIETPIVTIWVHGTRLLPDLFFHDFFHCPQGMTRAQDFADKYQLHQIAKTLDQADPLNYPFEHFYLYGWSGKLDFKERLKAARDLLKAIKEVREHYWQQYHVYPKIRIITHSHGGNVALNLIKLMECENFTIDELILLACPVQEKTARIVKDELFKKVVKEAFLLYSDIDLLQVIDPQGLYKHKKPRPLFSERRFPQQDNLTQVKLRLNGHSLFHVDFLRLRFVKLLPAVITKMRTWRDRVKKSPPSNEERPFFLSIITIK